MEIASCLDFLWKKQAKKELQDMSEMRRHTNQLVQNLLPLHVAEFYLKTERGLEDIFAERLGKRLFEIVVSFLRLRQD